MIKRKVKYFFIFAILLTAIFTSLNSVSANGFEDCPDVPVKIVK